MSRLNLALAVAILLAGGSLLPLTQDRAFLVQLAVMLLASVGIGAAARALRSPDWLARLLQLLPGVAAVWWKWEQWPELIVETAGYVATAYAPMPPHEGFRILTVAVLWLLFVVTETVAGGLDRPGWTFPVLVLPYLIPALVLNEETSAVYLALPCAGYLLVLATAVYNRAAPELTGGRRRLARSIGLTGAVVAVVAWTLSGFTAAVIPERGTALLDPSRIDTSVQLGDPTLDLIRNLRAPSGRPIINYTSSDGQGHYLRLAALSAFDRTGFHLVPTDLMPGLHNLPAGVDAEPVRLAVEVDDFGSEWLPVPWMPQAVEAAGDWRHDPATGAIVAVGPNRNVATRFLDYLVDARLMQPGQPEIAGAEAGDPGDGGLTLALPEELDPEVLALAQQLAGDGLTAGERILTLAYWLRSDEFTYSTAIVEGSTLDTVSDFLLVSRTGYCEQFAGSLAVLARAVGVPSRVVVGFLPGTATAEGYEVSTKDMHAWTEIFLDGLGWVAIDPTPSGAPGASPVPSPSPTATTPTPSEEPTDDGLPSASATPTEPTEDGLGGGGFRLPGWTGWLPVGLALVLLPAALRRYRTWRRLRPGTDPVRAAEDSWDELRDSVLDLGHAWPQGTPRQVAAELAAGLDAESAAAITRLGLQVERARFAPAEAVDRTVDPRLVRQLAATLEATAPHRQALGQVFPRSVFRWYR
jgi:transglutaminase-like putative cysteine protease